MLSEDIVEGLHRKMEGIQAMGDDAVEKSFLRCVQGPANDIIVTWLDSL